MPDGPPESSKPPRDWKTMHLWEVQPVRDVLLIIGIIALFKLGHMLSLVTVPLLLALLLAYLLEPVVGRLIRLKRVTRPVAAVAIIAVVAFVLIVPVGIGAAYGLVSGV